jgi:hypothetical protein
MERRRYTSKKLKKTDTDDYGIRLFG